MTKCSKIIDEKPTLVCAYVDGFDDTLFFPI